MGDGGAERRAAGVLLYRTEGGRRRFLLLLHRKGGHWSPPKGHLEEGETDLDAALRETEEECGLAVRALDPGFREEVRYEVERKGRRVPKTVVYFLAEAPPGEVRLSDEHTAHAWADLAEVRELVAFPNLVRVLEAADARAAARGGS